MSPPQEYRVERDVGARPKAEIPIRQSTENGDSRLDRLMMLYLRWLQNRDVVLPDPKCHDDIEDARAHTITITARGAIYYGLDERTARALGPTTASPDGTINYLL